QSMLKVRSDWPALTTALRLISQGRMGLGTTKDHYDKWRTVYVDEAPMGYAGLQIDGIGGVE
ncbi:MAG: hypothetical protein KKG59_00395, partial [Nanoarchaeota archaeon]|nr:hypothetical protein [Nanoarchaeota archaeon]